MKNNSPPSRQDAKGRHPDWPQSRRAAEARQPTGHFFSAPPRLCGPISFPLLHFLSLPLASWRLGGKIGSH